MSGGPIECEVKLRIGSRSDLYRLLRHLPKPRRWGLQLNVYLDTEDRVLEAARASLRLRVTPDHARLTAKWGRGVAGCTFRCVEVETPVYRDAAVAFIDGRGPLPMGDGFEDVTDITAGRPLVVVNWSLTHRTICDVDGFVVEADETIFPDGSRDFEVEVETLDPDAALALLQRVAAIAGIGLAPQTRTKQARAQACVPSIPLWIPSGDPAIGIPANLVK